jgi:hypothetical protein
VFGTADLQACCATKRGQSIKVFQNGHPRRALNLPLYGGKIERTGSGKGTVEIEQNPSYSDFVLRISTHPSLPFQGCTSFHFSGRVPR